MHNELLAAGLSARQREVVGMFARGIASKVIALDLDLTKSTVAHHLATAEHKLGLRRWEFARLTEQPASPLGASRAPATTPRMATRLTQAEREVVSLALKGWSNSRIATARSSSPRTVANQLANAYRKLEVGSRTDLYAHYGSQLSALDSLHSAA